MRTPGRGICLIVALTFGTVWSAFAKAEALPDLVLTGHVTVTTRRPPPCGGGAFAMKLRFQVEEVVAGDYRQPFVDVLVPCPEFFKIRLTTGARARLELAFEKSRSKRRWAFMGELPEPRFPQYWLIRAAQE